jgi:hypothetical protein
VIGICDARDGRPSLSETVGLGDSIVEEETA